MAQIFADRVMVTTTTTGVGDITPGSAVTGFQAFPGTIVDGDTFTYTMFAVDGSGGPTGEWESGYGTWNAGVIERTNPVDGSAALPISFSAGTKYIALTIIGDTMTYLLSYYGALVKKAADETAANYSTATAVAWTAEVYDTSGIHDNAANNERLTVPTGVTRVRLKVNIELASVTADTWVKIKMRKNGAAFDGQGSASVETGDTTVYINAESAEVTVVDGDYFDVTLQTEDTSVNVVAAGSWFAMEVIL